MTGQDVANTARECVGTPFKHQGRLVGVGLDCAGVIVHTFNSLNLPVFDRTDYGRTPNSGALESALDAQLSVERVLPISDMKIGDILLFRIKREPQHLAICSGDLMMIHAYEPFGRCIEHLVDETWMRKLVRVYRLIGLS